MTQPRMQERHSRVLKGLLEDAAKQITFLEGMGCPDMSGAIHAAADSLMQRIRQELAECRKCSLGRNRRNIVFGSGDPWARLMLVGEAPGEDEDRKGLPFVGRAGALLTEMLRAIGMRRDEVYIANIIKCRPTGNRDPEPDEIACCLPTLEAQIRAVKPKVLLALGRVASQVLGATDVPVTKLRGQRLDYHGIILIPTYHPAYLLRNPERKKEAWSDLKLVRSLLKGES